MGNIFQDLRFALRAWSRTPGFAAAAIATLALGIGANTAIFSVVSGVLLRPLPFADAERLMQISETQTRTAKNGGFEGGGIYGDLQEWRAHSRYLDGAITYTNSGRNLQGPGEPEQVTTVGSEFGLFHLLGVQPLLGRTFVEGDPMDVAVASHALWTNYFRSDASAVGRRILLDGQPFTLIG